MLNSRVNEKWGHLLNGVVGVSSTPLSKNGGLIMLRLSYALLLVSSSVFASAYPFPILQKTLGGLDKGTVTVKTCQVFDNHSKIKLADVLKLASEAENEPMSKSLHVRQEVPSVEVWVNVPTRMAAGPASTKVGPRKVSLLADSSSILRRNGKAGEELLKLVDELCKD